MVIPTVAGRLRGEATVVNKRAVVKVIGKVIPVWLRGWVEV